MENNKNNIGLALLTTFGVAVAGAIAWGLLATIGWFASIIAYASAILMFKVWKKFALVTKLTYIWILVVSIILNTFALYVAVVIGVIISDSSITLAVAIQAVISTFGEVTIALLLDIIFSILFTVLGVVNAISIEKKEALAKQLAKDISYENEQDDKFNYASENNNNDVIIEDSKDNDEPLV